MDRFERINNLEYVIRAALQQHASEQWTALPAIIHGFDAARHVITAQPAVKFTWLNKDGSTTTDSMPVIGDIPIMTPRGGGASLTFPIKAGDECLLIFADRCVDNWWANGGVQKQEEHRMHDLSDGFAIVGPYSQPQRITNWQTDTVELRSNDGQAVIRLNPTTHDIDIVSQGSMTITVKGDLDIMVNGNVRINGQTVRINE